MRTKKINNDIYDTHTYDPQDKFIEKHAQISEPLVANKEHIQIYTRLSLLIIFRNFYKLLLFLITKKLYNRVVVLFCVLFFFINETLYVNNVCNITYNPGMTFIYFRCMHAL